MCKIKLIIDMLHVELDYTFSRMAKSSNCDIAKCVKLINYGLVDGAGLHNLQNV